MKKIVVLLLVVLTLTSLVLTGCNQAAGGADKSWDKVKDKGVFIMGLDENFPPMGFKEGNEITGFDVDLAKEVCSRLGVELKLQPIDWVAKEQELNTGKIDCIWNGFTITPPRKEALLFTKPYMNNQQVLVVMEASNYVKLADLAGKKVAVQASSSADDAIDENTEFKSSLKEVVEFKDYTMALMDLEKGGVDAVAMDEIVAKYIITTNNKGYKLMEDTIASEEYGIGFRKNDTALMQKVQETLEAMAKDGKLAEISKKWFGEDITTIAK